MTHDEAWGNEDSEKPWYGIDVETGTQLFGPCDEEEAISRRNDHPRREHIELRRHPVALG